PATARAASYLLTLTASRSAITGGAGAALSANATRSWKMNTINGTASADVIKLVRTGPGNTYDVYLNNNTATADYSVNNVFAGGLSVAGNGGADTFDFVGGSSADAYTISTSTVHWVGGATVNFAGITTLGVD